MAAVTLPQEQGREAGWGQLLRGLPGFLTGTISRSLACVHLVERWPRMQGSLQGQQLAKSTESRVPIGSKGNIPGHLYSVDERHDGVGRYYFWGVLERLASKRGAKNINLKTKSEVV